VENQLKPYAHLSNIPDFARRSAEQAARLAGCFHVFDHGPHEEIAEGTMRQAITVVSWFLQETLRIFGSHDQPQEVLDAEALWSWCVHKDFETLTLSLISRYGPNHLRKHRERYRAAVNLLQDHGFLIKKEYAPEWIINPKAKT
jgi:putative DNA primase/helicase